MLTVHPCSDWLRFLLPRPCKHPVSAGERISDFSLIDQHGKFFQLSRQANFDAIVFMAHEDSRDVRRAASDLADLSTHFEGQNVGFCLSTLPVKRTRQKFGKLQMMQISSCQF